MVLRIELCRKLAFRLQKREADASTVMKLNQPLRPLLALNLLPPTPSASTVSLTLRPPPNHRPLYKAATASIAKTLNLVLVGPTPSRLADTKTATGAMNTKRELVLLLLFVKPRPSMALSDKTSRNPLPLRKALLRPAPTWEVLKVLSTQLSRTANTVRSLSKCRHNAAADTLLTQALLINVPTARGLSRRRKKNSHNSTMMMRMLKLSP